MCVCLCGVCVCTRLVWVRECLCVRVCMRARACMRVPVGVRAFTSLRSREGHMRAAREDPEEIEELRSGPIVPLIVRLADPRPRADAVEVRMPEDPDVAQLAQRTVYAAFARAGGSPLPPDGKFSSSAEEAELAAIALQALWQKPWACDTLSRAGFYTLVADLKKDYIIPRGAILTMGDLYRRGGEREGPDDPGRVALAWKFLQGGFMHYLLDRIIGMTHLCE